MPTHSSSTVDPRSEIEQREYPSALSANGRNRIRRPTHVMQSNPVRILLFSVRKLAAVTTDPCNLNRRTANTQQRSTARNLRNAIADVHALLEHGGI
ncbi:hypothetical protein D9615_007834 [Tricholomella constricta]|uniref:Uncharacterized protein n=1 Tax=Tricholomella constricta TaxID=117010 RepID=A0A8H5M0S7_9AGAR|nr:hypothetical protein D9615_007834 [Tricholomella constricta]